MALGTVPVIAGSLRLVELSGGASTMPSDARYDASPLPVVVHIVSATVFAILGAFQFSPQIRRRHPGWHRRAGRVLVVAGLGVALSALWLNQFYPNAEATREVLYPLRMAFGSAMVVTIVLGFPAARRRDFTHHRAWMIRSYAIGLVAGTQVFTLGIGKVVLGTGRPDDSPAHGGRLGHQPRRRRAGHPSPTAAPSPGDAPARLACHDRGEHAQRRRTLLRDPPRGPPRRVTGRRGSAASPSPTKVTGPPRFGARLPTRRNCTACSPRCATWARP